MHTYYFQKCNGREIIGILAYFSFLGKEKEVEGTLSVQPKSNPVKGFEEYFLNLTVQNNTRNPWFVGKLYIGNYLNFRKTQ